MGREIKRVALDFDYPINGMIWKGYHNPYSGLKCSACDGSGENPEMKKLSDDWYGFDRPNSKWCDKITDDEAKALFDEGRFRGDFETCPTGEQVNEWSKSAFIGHDCINKWICVKARAKRLGISTDNCHHCDGQGVVFCSDEYRQLHEDWKWVEPPEGDGYQLWSTTTEGTPMSPVFESPEQLATWLFENEASSFGSSTATYEQWLNFIRGPGWAPSAILSDGKMQSGVDAASSL
jgi:hypothetical protein